MGSTHSIATFDHEASFDAYVAAPEGTPKAAIIVIQEIFGVNPGIRQKCDGWAAQGYLAVAPDLFWRIKPGIELDPDVEAELHEAFGYFGQYDPDDGVKDIEATIRAIRSGIGGLDGVAKVGAAGALAAFLCVRGGDCTLGVCCAPARRRTRRALFVEAAAAERDVSIKVL